MVNTLYFVHSVIAELARKHPLLCNTVLIVGRRCMNRQEAKHILVACRPNRPQRSEKRQLQRAIDTAIETMDSYDNLIKSISVDIRSKWRKDHDTLKCTNCGFGYFPTNYFFMNGNLIEAPDNTKICIFKYCPNCGEKMGYDR